MGATVLLHLRLEEVTTAVGQRVPDIAFDVFELPAVTVVVLLGDLIAPPTVHDVAANHLLLQAVGDRGVPGLPELLDGLTERQVGRAAQPVEAVEVPASVLDDLQRLGELAEGSDGRVVEVGGRWCSSRWSMSATYDTYGCSAPGNGWFAWLSSSSGSGSPTDRGLRPRR